jgi:hypothetical protein
MTHWRETYIARVIVLWPDPFVGASGVSWAVGVEGVTAIEAIEKNGEYCSIPYVRIWRGTLSWIAEYSQHALREVRFAPSVGRPT